MEPLCSSWNLIVPCRIFSFLKDQSNTYSFIQMPSFPPPNFNWYLHFYHLLKLEIYDKPVEKLNSSKPDEDERTALEEQISKGRKFVWKHSDKVKVFL